MEVGQQTKLNFNGVDFVNVVVKMENPLPKDNLPPIDFQIAPKVFYPDNSTGQFIIINEVKILSKGFFEISVVAFGGFIFPDLKGDIRDQKDFININAPAIMFPYVRSFIHTLSANLGTGFITINIPPHFFQGNLEEYKPTKPADMPTVETIQAGRTK